MINVGRKAIRQRNARIASTTNQRHKSINQGSRVVAKLKENIGNSANVTMNIAERHKAPGKSARRTKIEKESKATGDED